MKDEIKDLILPLSSEMNISQSDYFSVKVLQNCKLGETKPNYKPCEKYKCKFSLRK